MTPNCLDANLFIMPKTLAGDIATSPYKAKLGHGTQFGDRVINLSHIAKAQGLCQSRLSRAFRGERPLHLSDVFKLSAYLGMPVEEFIATFQARLESIQKHNEQLLEEYTTRIDAEDRANIQRISIGKATVPSLPGLRA